MEEKFFRPTKIDMDSRSFLMNLCVAFQDLDNQKQNISINDIDGILSAEEKLKNYNMVIDFLKNIKSGQQPYVYYKQGFTGALNDHLVSISKKLGFIE